MEHGVLHFKTLIIIVCVCLSKFYEELPQDIIKQRGEFLKSIWKNMHWKTFEGKSPLHLGKTATCQHSEHTWLYLTDTRTKSYWTQWGTAGLPLLTRTRLCRSFAVVLFVAHILETIIGLRWQFSSVAVSHCCHRCQLFFFKYCCSHSILLFSLLTSVCTATSKFIYFLCYYVSYSTNLYPQISLVLALFLSSQPLPWPWWFIDIPALSHF